MPELPEVETVVRSLRPLLAGRTITGVRFGKTDFIDDPAALHDRLPGTCVLSVDRFGKFILVSLRPTVAIGPSGAGILYLMIHLGMTGRLGIRPADEPPLPHTHVFLELDHGRELRYTDPRRFGRILLVPAAGMAAFSARWGSEPLEVSAAQFRRLLNGRHARIKALLLDQRVLRGLGNIYADEILWRARIHPARPASGLGGAEVGRLRRALRRVLHDAIRLRGSSISDFVDGNGEPGEYQRHHRVYRRQGAACLRCGSIIRRILVAGRGSAYCPQCQLAPRPRRRSASSLRRPTDALSVAASRRAQPVEYVSAHPGNRVLQAAPCTQQ